VVRLGGSDCEQLVGGLLAQPVNALSSGAFVLAGGLAVAAAMRVTGRVRVLVAAFAVTLIGVGVGSVAYHGPQPPWAGAAHDGSVLLALVSAVPLVMHGRIWRTGVGRLTAALAAAALMAYAAGRTGSPLCDPDSPAQPHALWHVLVAASASTLAWAAIHPPAAGSAGARQAEHRPTAS
jgi:hypothetical protein